MKRKTKAKPAAAKAEIKDAPAGFAWKCPDCGHASSSGGYASEHRSHSTHGEPVLLPIDSDGFVGIDPAPVVDEPADEVKASKLTIPDSEQIRIYIVWTVGTYANGVRMLDIRAVTTSRGKAILYSKMLRRDKQPGEMWERVIIEPRCANHLYAELRREMLVNTGRM